MKTKVLIASVAALFLGACTTGSFVSRSSYDDVYFNPGDVPAPVAAESMETQEPLPVKEKSGEKLIISQIQDNNDGSRTMNNYIFGSKDSTNYADAQLYNLNQMEPDQSDTTILYNDDQVKYVINNYYEGDDLDYENRIRRFHRPYFYDPFYWNSWSWDPWYWDSWYSPYWSMSWGWGGGWNSPYSWYGGYGGWYSPYSWYGGYGGWYSPYSWYGGYGGWYSPYSWYGGYGGWYSPYYSGWGNSRYWNSDDYRYEKRRTENTNVLYGGGGGSRGMAADRSGVLKSGEQGSQGVVSRRGNGYSGADGASHPVATGAGNNSLTQKSGNAGVLVEKRRNFNSPTSNLQRNSGTTVNRNSGFGTSVSPNSGVTIRRSTGNTTVNNDYQPSYNQTKSATRSSSYNRESYTRPATSTYTAPRVISNSGSYQRSSSSGVSNTYRSTSTYNRSSASGSTYNRSYSSSPSGSYSSPSSNYSGGGSSRSSGSSYSGGGGYSGGSSGGGYSGGSSGGSSGSSHSSGSSSSGRR